MRGMTVGCVAVISLAIGPNGSGAATGSPLAQDGEVTALAYSADARLLAVGTKERTITLWDLRKGQKRHVLSGTVGRVLGLAFSPDGKMLASIGTSDEKARLWSPTTGEAIRHLSLFEIDGVSQGFTAISFTPDSSTIVLGEGGGRVTLWNAATGTHRRLDPPHDALVTAVAVTPDGTAVLSVDYKRRVRIRPIGSRPSDSESLGTIGEGWPGLAIAPDGQTMALGGSQNTYGRSPETYPIEIWDLRSRTQSAVIPGHRAPAHALAFAAGGRLLVSAAPDGTVSVWNASTGKSLLSTTGVVFAVSANSLAVGEGSAVKIVQLPGLP